MSCYCLQCCDDLQEGTEEEGEKGAGGDGLTPQQRARHAITGRGVTLSMLMADGVIEPGEDNMSIEYLVRAQLVNIVQYNIYYSF